MSLPPRPVPAHVPTLTEVIEFDVPPPVPALAPPQPAEGQDVAALPGASPDPAATGEVQAPSPPALTVSPSSPPVAEPAERAATPPSPASTSTLPVGVASTPTPIPARPAASASASASASATVPPFVLDEAQIAQRLLADVQRQIDGMLEYRLRETLAPILARASEALVRELRQELSRTMRDVVSRAVAQEVARQRTRS